MKNLTKISFLLLCLAALISFLPSCQKYGAYPFRNQPGFNNNQFPHRTDTIAVSALPAVIKSYFTNNYPKDTLQHAFINRDSSYAVISADTDIFVTMFTSAGAFEKRTLVYPHVISKVPLTQGELPSGVITYLTSNYPGYSFDAAYEIELNGKLAGYSVFIDYNKNKYLVEFDSNGTFVASYNTW